MPELVFSSGDKRETDRIYHLVRTGKLRKIAPKLYSSNLIDDPKKIVRDHLYEILGRRFPRAVLSHRTALEGKPSANGTVFLTYTYTKKFRLPGHTIRVLKGPGPVSGDTLFMGRLHIASRQRAFLENLQPSRGRGPDAKSVSREELEERLDRIVRIHGEAGLDALRDQARTAAAETGMGSEFEKLGGIIGALLRSRPAGGLRSAVSRARATGEPFDPDRVRLFETLFAALRDSEFPRVPEPHRDSVALGNLAFFEAYFSNYIEGTRFEVEAAREIVFDGKIPPARPDDAHDILGTYRVVSSREEMRKLPKNAAEFLALLRARHETLLASRRDKNPGEFKDAPNRAGDTLFVAPELVGGTLIRGFEFYKPLESPLARAMYAMFLISEVHPFNDGNGRIARVLMNAELVKTDERRIIIPTVFRDDYLGALRALSRQGRPEPYIRMLAKAREFSAALDFSDFNSAKSALERANAFREPGEATLAYGS
ncbi:MAG: Fic family protein [Elusimicrobia bacterium]|nr:Fic family protein [Elusimicrobiota bacterium]